MKDFIPFDLERWQSKWETTVQHNLAESGVGPVTVDELLRLTGTDPAELGRVRLGYSQTIGTLELRTAIAGLYPGATAENVLVTVGSSEANFISTWTLVGPGDSVAVQVPVYQQILGVARNLGATVKPFGLDPEAEWALSLPELDAATAGGVSAIVVTNPNNPTGHVLTPEERAAILDRARAHDAWLLVDEVYRGAEFGNVETESFWGATERTVVTGGLSKAYGLPGLRLGWIVAPAEVIAGVAARHDYAVIGPSGISDFLAIRALANRAVFRERTHRMLHESYGVLREWRAAFDSVLEWTPPAAGAILFARYRLNPDSPELVEFLRAEHDVLLVPGAHFDMGKFLRIGFGEPPSLLLPALDAMGSGLRNLIRD